MNHVLKNVLAATVLVAAAGAVGCSSTGATATHPISAEASTCSSKTDPIATEVSSCSTKTISTEASSCSSSDAKAAK